MDNLVESHDQACWSAVSCQLRWAAAVRILMRSCIKKAVTNNTLLISNGQAFYKQQWKRTCKQLTSNIGHVPSSIDAFAVSLNICSVGEDVSCTLRAVHMAQVVSLTEHALSDLLMHTEDKSCLKKNSCWKVTATEQYSNIKKHNIYLCTEEAAKMNWMAWGIASERNLKKIDKFTSWDSAAAHMFQWAHVKALQLRR